MVETAPKAPPAPTVESKPEERAAPAPKVLDFSVAKNKAPGKEEAAPEKKPVKEQTEEKPKRGRPAKTDKAAPAEKPKQPRDKMSQGKKAPGKETPIPPKPEAAPKEAKLNPDVIDGILSQEKKKEDRNVIINGAELEKYFGKDKSPREMKDQIIALLDDWKAKQPPELAKPQKKTEKAL